MYRKVRCIARDNVQDAPPQSWGKSSEKTTGPLENTHPKNAEIYQSLILPEFIVHIKYLNIDRFKNESSIHPKYSYMKVKNLTQ